MTKGLFPTGRSVAIGHNSPDEPYPRERDGNANHWRGHCRSNPCMTLTADDHGGLIDPDLALLNAVKLSQARAEVRRLERERIGMQVPLVERRKNGRAGL